MTVYSLYFSPTGGTKKVMDILSEELDVTQRIDLSAATENYSKYEFLKEDVCLIGVPSFGGRVPEAALAALKQMQVTETKAILVVVYGNRAYDDTLLELKNEIVTYGFRPAAAIAAVAEHSIMARFGTGRPDASDMKELSTYACQLKKCIDDGQLKEDITVPGNYPYREYSGVPFKPSAGRKCRKCGLCVTKCPVSAISKENPAATDGKKCISCMRCITVCPEKARSLNKLMLSVAAKKMEKVCSTRKKNELFI